MKNEIVIKTSRHIIFCKSANEEKIIPYLQKIGIIEDVQYRSRNEDEDIKTRKIINECRKIKVEKKKK